MDKTKQNIIGKQYQNLVTGNQYRCIGYDGEDLTLEGIGKQKVIFNIPLCLAVLKYREIEAIL